MDQERGVEQKHNKYVQPTQSDVKNQLSAPNRTDIESKLLNDMKNAEIAHNNYKVFGTFVEDSLSNMSKSNAEKAVLEIVEIIYKYRAVDEQSPVANICEDN